MAFAACIPDQAKQDFLQGVHVFASDTFKIALYTQAGATDKNKSIATYNTTGELATAGGYTQGGVALITPAAGLSTDTAWVSFANPSWASATFTADSAVIYNSSKSSKVVAVLSFGSTTVTAGTFTVQFPATGTTAVITIS